MKGYSNMKWYSNIMKCLKYQNPAESFEELVEIKNFSTLMLKAVGVSTKFRLSCGIHRQPVRKHI